jgi:putative transposase
VNFKNKEWIMPGPKPPAIKLTDAERQGLEKLVSRRTTEQQKVLRGRIALLAAAGKNTPEIAKALNISLDTARLWRRRWLDLQAIGLAELSIEERLEDLPRSGAPAQITADQICQIEQMACEKPEKSGRPISQWTGREIADEIVRRGILESISPRHASRLLKKGVSNRT